jgi:hypothetical protein
MLRAIVLLLAVATTSSGCVAPLLPILTAGAEGALKAGSSSMSGGVAYRTFTLPAYQVVTGARLTLQRMDLTVLKDDFDGERHKISAEATDRIVRVTVERVTPAVSRLGVAVYRHRLFKDLATSSEIIAQTEETLNPTRSARR